MTKDEILRHWRGLSADQPIVMEPIPYAHEGSTFDHDSIRITGSQRFIDAVLSRLKDLLSYEVGRTRLQVAYQEARDRDTGVPLGTYSCYVQVHERGNRT